MSYSIRCGGNQGFILSLGDKAVSIKWKNIDSRNKVEGVDIDAPKDVAISVLWNSQEKRIKKMKLTEEQYDQIMNGNKKDFFGRKMA